MIGSNLNLDIILTELSNLRSVCISSYSLYFWLVIGLSTDNIDVLGLVILHIEDRGVDEGEVMVEMDADFVGVFNWDFDNRTCENDPVTIPKKDIGLDVCSTGL